MRNSIIPCRKCGKLVNVRLPSGASGVHKRSYWGRSMTLPRGPLTSDVFKHIYKCKACGGKYK